jgi:predicted PurR-regulated permease PerM
MMPDDGAVAPGSPPDDGAAAAHPPPGLVPIWLENLAAYGWRILAVVGLAVVLAAIALTLISITASLVLSAIIAAAVAPLVISLRARGWSRAKSALAAWAVAGGIIVVALALIVIAFVPAIADLLRALQAGLDAMRSGSAGFTVPAELSSAIDKAAAGVTDLVKDLLGDLVGRVSLTATIAVLSTFLTFFVLLDADHGADWALQAVHEADRPEVRGRGRDAALRVGGFVRAIAVAAAVRAGIMLVALLVLGTPYAGPLAAVVLVGGLIPYLGTLTATLLVLLVALGGQGMWQAAALLAVAIAIDVAIARVRGRSEASGALRVHPAIALLALPVGAIAAGLIGMIVAVPVAGFIEQMARTAIAAFEPRLPATSYRTTAVPGWLDRLAQWSWRLLVATTMLVALVLLTLQLSGAVLAVVLAAVLAATLAPAASALRRRGMGATTAALVATVGLVAGIGVILVLTVVSLVRDMGEIVAQSTAGASSASQSANGSLDWLSQLVSTVSGGALDAVIAFAAMPTGLVFVGVLAAILTFFFLRDGEVGWRWATRMLVGWRRREVDAAGGRAAGVLGGYMIATGVISAFGAATQFAIMTILGLPLALPLAVLSFFGGFIPYIGSFITTGIAFLVTVAVGSPTDIAVMAIFTLVFNIVQGNFVAPLVYGKAVNIHPAIVLIAIPAGSTIAGVFGMFIVVPFIGVVAATWRTVLFVLGDAPGDAGGAVDDGATAGPIGAEPALDDPGGSPTTPAPTT